jgi:hypothetical protein
MPNTPIWPHDKIRELLAIAEITGEAKAELNSYDDAESFRYAIYYFRKQNNLGNNLTITIEGNWVFLKKKPEVAIVQREEV